MGEHNAAVAAFLGDVMHTVTISKRFDFDAAHHLPNVPAGHKCGRPHGHTYVVEVILRGEVKEPAGWFVDYADIATAWAPIGDDLDHRDLNKIDGLENPTTENLVKWIWDRLHLSVVGRYLLRIRVFESSTTWCEYGSDD